MFTTSKTAVRGVRQLVPDIRVSGLFLKCFGCGSGPAVALSARIRRIRGALMQSAKCQPCLRQSRHKLGPYVSVQSANPPSSRGDLPAAPGSVFIPIHTSLSNQAP